MDRGSVNPLPLTYPYRPVGGDRGGRGVGGVGGVADPRFWAPAHHCAVRGGSDGGGLNGPKKGAI
jgi:hypothetical protein